MVILVWACAEWVPASAASTAKAVTRDVSRDRGDGMECTPVEGQLFGGPRARSVRPAMQPARLHR